MTWALQQVHDANSSALVQVVILVIAALAVSVIGYMYKRNRGMYNDVHDIKDVLITPKPTGLVPNPPKGLVDVVADHTRILGALLSGTTALVADKSPNAGNSSRDVADRTEKIVGELQKEQARVAETLARE